MSEVPKRTPCDGPVSVHRMDEETIALAISHNGKDQGLVASPYNMARTVVMLCTVLGVPCPTQLRKMPM